MDFALQPDIKVARSLLDSPSSCWQCLKPGRMGASPEPILMAIRVVLKPFCFDSVVMSSYFNLFRATAAFERLW